MATKAKTPRGAKRKGTANPRRKSQITKKKPTARLVKRRTTNTRKGYFPNPVHVARLYVRSGAKVIGTFDDTVAGLAHAKVFATATADKTGKPLQIVRG